MNWKVNYNGDIIDIHESFFKIVYVHKNLNYNERKKLTNPTRLECVYTFELELLYQRESTTVFDLTLDSAS